MDDGTIVLKDIFCLLTDPDKPWLRGCGPADAERQGWRRSFRREGSPFRKVPGASIARTMWWFRGSSTPTIISPDADAQSSAVQNAELFDWLTFLYDVWKYNDEDAVYYSTALAMAELLKTGCTCSTDHHYL
jgi:hypothetical protein